MTAFVLAAFGVVVGGLQAFGLRSSVRLRGVGSSLFLRLFAVFLLLFASALLDELLSASAGWATGFLACTTFIAWRWT